MVQTAKRAARIAFAGAVGWSMAASARAQTIPFTPAVPPSGVNSSIPPQNLLGPTGAAFQVAYPYPGQCLASAANGALFPLLPVCQTADPAAAGYAGSFLCGGTAPVLGAPPLSNQSAGGWMSCGATPFPFAALNPILANSVPPPGTPPTPKFQWQFLNPPDYAPDTTTYPGADYYEIGVHEAWGFQAVASAGLFPNPLLSGRPAVPDGMQWTGIVCNVAGGCSCPPGLADPFRSQYCSAAGKVPAGAPLYTPVWGVGQINGGGGPVTTTLSGLGLFTPGSASAWSANNYVATWPSVSIRATRFRPLIVRWVNEFPNNHVFCPHPEAADWPCAIDRTFMGVRATSDPALTAGTALSPDGVNQWGSPQQPDNSWVTHYHGAETPPGTDGFAERWFGNAVTAAAFANASQRFLNPPFDNPLYLKLQRPAGSSDLYTYPNVNDEATIWFHDHTLGKTHHNVIAGPAGFAPVKDYYRHGGVGTGAGVCPTPPGSAAPLPTCTSDYTWLDPVTEPRNALNQPLYDLFLAIQDRSFNDDGSINFSNGLGQVIPLAKKLALPIGYTPLTPGPNPQVHPTWAPEYFGDHVLVNGVVWPKAAVSPGWYRVRIVDGSDSRCWTLGLTTVMPLPRTKPVNNVPYWVVANDQGYLRNPVLRDPNIAPSQVITICPGERYELLVNFGAVPGANVGAGVSVYMTNTAPAPFPAGITPYDNGSPFAEMNTVMRFDVSPANPDAPVRTCAAGVVNNWDPTWTQAQMAAAVAVRQACMPANPALVTDPNFVDIRPPQPFPPGTVVRQVYLNERLDGVTFAPFGMQLNGVPFEYKVTETPRKDTREVWQFINLTVDAHPMHPHLVKHQIVSRQPFNVGQYKALLCGSTTCQPGTVPGGQMQIVPDVTPLLGGGPARVTAAMPDGGWKDATPALPGMVTTIVADWTQRWISSATPNAPGTAGYVPGTPTSAAYCPTPSPGCQGSYLFEDVTQGPYVWHCHINSHEDSEMMRTSLVVP